MVWFFLGLGLVLLYYFLVLKKRGNIDFWRKAGKFPDAAYQYFKGEDCWLVFEEEPPPRKDFPPGEWDGPFRLAVPMLGGKTVTVFGRAPEYILSQQRFMKEKAS